jgi:hypothetical protein
MNRRQRGFIPVIALFMAMCQLVAVAPVYAAASYRKGTPTPIVPTKPPAFLPAPTPPRTPTPTPVKLAPTPAKTTVAKPTKDVCSGCRCGCVWWDISPWDASDRNNPEDMEFVISGGGGNKLH